MDTTSNLPRYSIRHESIRAWIRDDKNALVFGVKEERGHAYLAASLLQRCQQIALTRWLQADENSCQCRVDGSWYERTTWEPNTDEEDIFHLARHLARSNRGSEKERISLLESVGKEILDSAFRGRATALHSASSSGETEAVKFLLEAGADPCISLRGRQPIHLASSKGFARTVEVLIANGADVTTATSSGRTPLVNAAGRGSVNTVRCILKAIREIESKSDFLIDLSEPDHVDASQDDTGRTALSLACEEGFDTIIRILLDAGASPCLADRWGRTPLYYAARYGLTGGDSIKALVSVHKSAKETLFWGHCGHNRSPLHEAVWYGHISAVKALLEAGADPNLVENDGGSPLHEAAFCGSYGNEKEKTRKKLKRRRQMAETTLSGGSSACVESLEDESGEEISKRLEIIRQLLQTGRCLVDMVESHGCTPLWYATCQGWTDAVEMLIHAGASTNPFDFTSPYETPSSPLMISLKQRYFKTARVLIRHSARFMPFEIDLLSSVGDMPVDVSCAVSKLVQGVSEAPSATSAKKAPQGIPCDAIPKDCLAWTPNR